MNSTIAARNGGMSRPCSSQRHAMNAVSAVIAGTGHRKKMFGSENQRSRCAGMRAASTG